MKYKISKKKVIEAILTEPLKPGTFFSNELQADDGKCPVCAVGAVLRKTKAKTFNRRHAEASTDYSYVSCDVGMSYFGDNFLSILSTEYETAGNSMHENEDVYLPRFHALMVAEGMCPDVLEFEV